MSRVRAWLGDRRRRALWWLLASWLWQPGSAAAQQQVAEDAGDDAGAAEAEPNPEREKLEQAKALFFEGNELRKAGDCARALERYLRSRALVPSVSNTQNAAVCLGELGRHDEALELYEALLTEFRERIDDAAKQAIAAETAALRARVGSLDVVANVDGQLVIDGRPRGKLPLLAPVRVLPGKHDVRVLKEGYDSFEKTVDVRVGGSVRVDARLRVLTDAGRVRIEGDGTVGAEVFIDGAPVGTAPWEGTLAPGEHYYVLRKDDAGTAPSRVTVVAGQAALLTPKLQPLGPELRISVKPASAELAINELGLAKGRWSGRLPIGTHAVEASEAGYVTTTRKVAVDGEGPRELSLELAVDGDHPRWGTNDPSRLWVEAFGGPGLAPSLGSAAESGCDEAYACPEQGLGFGFLAAGRAGYEFPIGVSVEIGGGYLRLSKDLSRAIEQPAAGSVPAFRYDIDDALRVSGAVAVAGVGYRLPLVEPLELRAHLLVGALFASAVDTVTASADGGVPASVQGSGQSASAPNLVVLPELQLGLRFGGFGAGAGLTVAIVTLDGPSSKLGQTQVDPAGCPMNPVACAAGTRAIEGEAAYGPFVAFIPSVSAGYAFSL